MEICVASTRSERMRGLRNRTTLGANEGLLFPRCRSVHTFGMRFPIAVVYLDAQLRVVDIVRMSPNRLGRPRLRARHVLEAAPDLHVDKGTALEKIGQTRRPEGRDGPGDILCCPKGWEPVPIV